MKKRALALVLVGILTLSMSANVLAASYEGTGNNLAVNESDLNELWTERRDSFELVSSTDDNRELVSQFISDNVIYQVEETINDDYSIVISDFYKLDGVEKKYLGQQKTEVVQSEENVMITVSEDGEIIDTQSFQVSVQESLDTSTNQETEWIIPKTARAVEYKWFSQGKANGSNNIYRYTVGGIVAALATAAGSAAAAGLSAIAAMVISDHWPAVYWTRQTWHYMMRTPTSPLYPSWISAYKYKYKTWYYSNSARTNLIGTTSHVDG